MTMAPRQGWRRLRRAFGMVRDGWPLTWLGLLVAAGCTAALVHWGLEQIDLVLLVVGLVGLVLVALSVLLVGGTAALVRLALRRRTSETALQLECGHPTRTDFSLLRPWFVPLVRIGWSWLEPQARVALRRSGTRWTEEVWPLRRALCDRIVRRFEVSDVFGLARVRFTAQEKRSVRFVPSMGALRNIHCVRAMAGGEDIPHPEGPPEGERADLRRYVPGDPVRFILWKVFARTREVMVRTPERAIAMVERTIAYLVVGPGDEPAAGAARLAAQSGALGSRWVLGADGSPEPATDRARALELLCKSGEVDEAAGGSGLADFLRKAAPGGTTRAVLFVPPRPGPWLERVAAALRGAGRVAVDAVVCCDGIEAPPGKGLWRKLAYGRRRVGSGALGKPVAAAELAAVVQALVAARARVIVVDRTEGRAYSQASLRSLEVAA
ncbi:MAG: DUF58 domain-containing protein [Myxococcales bacterium]|nr:DUF58 domain-containing protein [Myxococcales bacterium]